MLRQWIAAVCLGSCALLALSAPAWAHVFPKTSQPRVGATVKTAPQNVKIWFDGGMEPVFSHLVVKNAAGKVVSKGQGKVTGTDQSLLETRLPAPLPNGVYEVYWSVIAHDGHHTQGHFAFTVKVSSRQ